MKYSSVAAVLLCITINTHGQQFISDNVVAGASGTHWQGFKSNGPSTKWGFQQNDLMYIGLGGNLYNRGFSANAMGIFNGSTDREDIFLYNQNSPYADFLVLKASGNVGIGTVSPTSKLHVQNGSIQLSHPIFHEINTRLVVDEEVPSIRFTRWTGTAQQQHNAFIGQFYNTGLSEYSLALGTGKSTDGNQNTATTRMTITHTGNIGIGTLTPQEKLVVAGNIHAQKVKVTVNAGADFVFEPGYRLKNLEEVKRFIQEHKHLPEIPSAKEMETNGIELTEMSIKLLQKVEELTLHLIEQKQEIENLRKELSLIRSK
ncbi:tail fiber protein [Terrimonas sp. NA20]|uniref:Tail fiber protein n=1 Tax=Terrimonas ginsenosidimutans TaxID=2908004 RepID=A0ABS9KKV7_9BACT|nr:tail fiber protein [Terrimonas ginsenosidimutans]MCG2612947.1 tail fiber protein [Terrimonas ginsenosidimutans]